MNNFTTNVIKETSKGLQPIMIDDELMSNREIFLTEQVNTETSTLLLKKLMYLDRENPGEPITLYITSPGGDVTSGLAVYDYIKLMESPVHTVCIGLAASMGAILFLAGEKRKMLPNTKVMIHDPSFANAAGISGKPLEMKEKLDQLMKVRETLASIIAERTGMTMRQVYAKTKNDTYLTAEQALAFNVATEILK